MFSANEYNYIMKVYSQLIASERSTSSVANCSINIGKIEGILNDNCNILISNMCQVKNALPLLDVAINKFLSMKNNNTYNLSNVYNEMRLQCTAKADLLQSINIQNILIGECNSDRPITFSFVNSGDAVANCLSNLMLSSTLSSHTEIHKPNDPSLITSNIKYVVYGLCLVGFLTMTYVWGNTFLKSKVVLYKALT